MLSNSGKLKAPPPLLKAPFGMGAFSRGRSFSRSSLHGYVCRLSIHHGAGAFGAGSIVVESILVDGKAPNIAMQPTPIDGPTEGHHAKRGFE